MTSNLLVPELTGAWRKKNSICVKPMWGTLLWWKVLYEPGCSYDIIPWTLGKSLLSSLPAVSLKFAVRNYFIICSFPYSFVLKLAAPRMNLVLWLYSVNTFWLFWKCEVWHFMFSGGITTCDMFESTGHALDMWDIRKKGAKKRGKGLHFLFSHQLSAMGK